MWNWKTCVSALCAVLLFVSTAEAKANDDQNIYTNSIGMEFALVPAGSVSLERNHDSERKRARSRGKAAIADKAFYLGIYEVTQEQWTAVMGAENNPSRFKGPHHPVEHVSWDEAQEFIRRLNSKEGHERYRLPTEMEWLYALFSGAEPSYSSQQEPTTWAAANDFFGDHAWFYKNAEDPTHPVGQKKPNRYGIYDLAGNVHEWTHSRNTAQAPSNAVPSPKSYQVHSGDRWIYLASYCTLEPGVFRPEDPVFSRIGLRLVLDPE
ncbi:formylglycine-generating enzyme family protein [Desulfovibrio sp. OttesenSCG-928-I05]|nr:formylglycine-generating enzyme family protein [Desulfovibrio sp. OttesenSCG-928-I05]